MLDPEVEWVGAGEVTAIANRADVLHVLRDRVARITRSPSTAASASETTSLSACASLAFELDPTDDRPLQSRRSFLVGRYAAIVTMHDGRVARRRRVPASLCRARRAGLEDENP